MLISHFARGICGDQPLSYGHPLFKVNTVCKTCKITLLLDIHFDILGCFKLCEKYENDISMNKSTMNKTV